jgi:hypothetical protein
VTQQKAEKLETNSHQNSHWLFRRIKVPNVFMSRNAVPQSVPTDGCSDGCFASFALMALLVPVAFSWQHQ